MLHLRHCSKPMDGPSLAQQFFYGGCHPLEIGLSAVSARNFIKRLSGSTTLSNHLTQIFPAAASRLRLSFDWAFSQFCRQIIFSASSVRSPATGTPNYSRDFRLFSQSLAGPNGKGLALREAAKLAMVGQARSNYVGALYRG